MSAVSVEKRRRFAQNEGLRRIAGIEGAGKNISCRSSAPSPCKHPPPLPFSRSRNAPLQPLHRSSFRQAIRRSSIRRQCRLSVQPAGTTRAGEAVRRMWSTSEVSPCAGRLPRYACPQPALCGGTPSAGCMRAARLRPAVCGRHVLAGCSRDPTRYALGNPSCGRTSGGRTPLRGCPALRCGRRP